MKDPIERQTAIEAVSRGCQEFRGILARCEKNLNELPSAQPERKPGKWILDDEYIDCSACRHEKWSRVPFESLVKRFKFCPNCGADMRGET